MEDYDDGRDRVVGLHGSLPLTDVVSKWKHRIAAVAGTTPDRVKITIDRSGAAEIG